jgi:tRNA (mo5U34)-methyltransferase
MERRGAREVLALDILDPRAWDWPPGSDEAVVAAIGRRKGSGTGFEVAREALGSSVRRLELSVYDLDPEEHGLFDVVYLGSLLLHLRDPVRALERVRSVCSGSAVICDAVDAPLTELHRRSAVASLDGRGRPWWWKPNLAGLVRMIEAAGLKPLAPPVRLRMPPGPGHPSPQWRARRLLTHNGRVETMRAWHGDPHAIVRARPAVG